MEGCFNNKSMIPSYDQDDFTEPFEISGSNLSCLNDSRNGTEVSPENEFLVTIVVGVVLGLIILVTVVGNVFVLAAIWMEKNLHSLQNYLIFSLAVADLMVACLVMPLGAVYEISKSWSLGEWLCITWTSSDVLSCTASILHLVAIAMDRFWAVTDIDYTHRRNTRRVLTMIATVWGLALLISIFQYCWKDDTWEERIHIKKECAVNQDKYFQIFATLSSFYVPLAVILVLYWKIFQAARKRIRKRRPPPATSLLPRPAAETSLITTASSSNPSPEKTVLINNYGGVKDGGVGGHHHHGEDAGSTSGVGSSTHETPRKGTLHHQLLPPGSPGNSSAGITPETTPARKIKTTRETGESKRERKAAKTLGIITGCFIGCWLPFFVMALTLSICGPACEINRYYIAIIQWLGFLNSTLNPVIYTIFSPEFRLAFKKILFGKQTRKSNRAVAV